ncbi:MAG: PrgI family protein [Patescibacteria group bacterium]
MATFQVPQFIDQKPKIVGPLTLSQFFYIAIAAGISFASFYIFNLFVWVLVSIILITLSIGLAFVKINGQEMPKVIRAGLHFFLGPRIYTWQRTMEEPIYEEEKIENARKTMGTKEKLNSIVLNVTTGKMFSPKQMRNEQKKEEYQVATFETGERRRVKKVNY